MDPVSTMLVDVWLKQIDRSLLSELGFRAIRAAFPGFLDADEYWAQVGELAKDNPAVEQIAVRVEGDEIGQERRFAGDHTLPRGSYFSLAHDESGNDDGTLLAELYAYHDPDRAGPVLLEDIDLTSDEAREPLRRPLPPGHNLLNIEDNPPPCRRAIAVQFCPHDRQPHPFAREYLETPVAFGVLLPVSVTRRRMPAIDLRDPFLANYFARWMSRLGKSAGEFPFFKYRPAVEQFIDILFTMLSQERGGGAFCKIAGLVLRQMGYPALIYPSARADPGVELRRGEIISWRGWNLVDYTNAPPPIGGLFPVDRSDYWDPLIGERKGGLALGGEGEFLPHRELTCWVSSDEESEGSWQIQGLTKRLNERLRSTFARYGLELREK